MASSPLLATRRSSALEAVIVGGLVAGALDIVYAIVVSGFRDIPADVVLQSITSGLIGREAYRGGAGAAALGLGLHFLMTTAMAGAYVAAAQRRPTLLSRPVICGTAYGIGVYFFMNYVVLPLSAFYPGQPFLKPVSPGGLAIHAFGVGLPIALIAARRRRRDGLMPIRP